MTKKFHALDASTMKLLEQAERFKIEGAFEDAIALLEQIIAGDLSCGAAYEELGDNYLSLRELGKSRRALEHAVKLNDESANAFYLLGFLCSLELLWKDSVIALQKADQLHPNHPEILRCMGWSLFNAGERAQGTSVLERAHNLNNDDINIMCDLGVCYMNLSEYGKATNLFRRVIASAPESEQAQECEQFIEMIERKAE